MRKLLLLFTLLFLINVQTLSFSADFADQNIGGTLDECFSINNTEVNGVDFPCGSTTTLDIVSIVGTTFTFTDIFVDTTTNNSSPYAIDAAITNLTGPGGALTTSIVPASIPTGGAPGQYNVGPYTPSAIVPLGTIPGIYTGTVTFTLTTT